VWVKEQRQLLIDRENALVDMAIDLPGFDEFWESVPDFGTYAERIQSLEEFIASHTPIVAPKPKTVTTSSPQIDKQTQAYFIVLAVLILAMACGPILQILLR